MSISTHETNHTSINADSEETPFVITSGYPDVTYSGSSQSAYMVQPFENSILESLKSFWSSAPPGAVKDQVGYLFEYLGYALLKDLPAQYGASFIPKINTFQTGEDSALIEWIAHDIRLGFNIEGDPSQSSWYLATSDKLGCFSASGQLSVRELSTILDELVSVIRQFS